MTEELRKVYLDEDDNLLFENQYLEEIKKEQSKQNREAGVLEKLLEKLVQNTQDTKQVNLKNIAERFVIEKFTSKNLNANQWIDIFEKECIRFDVTEDEKKIEILRLFMDKSCVDWYSSMMLKLTMNSEWSTWKKKFCESFTNKGWNQITYALSFKYKDGSLVDYAIKKEKLLLEMRNSIDTGTLIDLIATGLPEYVLNRIDRETLQDTVDLFNEMRKLEYLINKKNTLNYKKYGNPRGIPGNEGKSPCKTCERLNKGIRYHPEHACWFKIGEGDKTKEKTIRHVNNSVIEAELQETEQKN